MKRFVAFILTAVLTAISTVFALETLNASATEEVEALVECTTMAETVKALRAGAGTVRYSDSFMTIRYRWNPGIPEDIFNDIFAWCKDRPEEFREFQIELQREHGLSWDEYHDYCMEPYYTGLHIYGSNAVVMTL